jgi:hypothetical protein
MAGSSRRVRRAVVIAVTSGLGVAALAWVAWYVFGQSEPTPWNKPAVVEGDVVHLTYTGSECQDSASVDVDEDARRVTLTVRQIVRAGACSDLGVRYDIDAQLDAPLGDRTLVDGACELAELSHYTECSPKIPTR